MIGQPIGPLDGRSHFTEEEILAIGSGVCEVDGHLWGDAGGGLLVCLRCEAEQWDDDTTTGEGRP